MIYSLFSVTRYLPSLWKPETDPVFSKQSNPFQVEVQLAKKALNQQISNLLLGCTLCKATLSKTKENKLSLHSKLEGTVVFSDEETMDKWLAEKAVVNIWQIEDLREETSRTFYKLQKIEDCGYDTFETRDELFDQLREDYGVFWKLEDLVEDQTSYIRFKTGFFGSHYVNVRYEDLTSVANSLELASSDFPMSSLTSGRTSWGKRIVACIVGGSLLSAGRSWGFNQTSVPDAIATMKGAFGPTASKAAFAFQTSIPRIALAAAITAVSRQQGNSLLGMLLVGMMTLPELAKGQSLCPQLVGGHDMPENTLGIAISDDYAYVADSDGGLRIISMTDKAHPKFAGFYDTTAVDVAVSGDYAYVAKLLFGLQIINIENKAHPKLVGFSKMHCDPCKIAVSGNYAYVACLAGWDSIDHSGVQIIDVSDKTKPKPVGFYDMLDASPNGIFPSGNYTYVAADGIGLEIIDVSNPANPKRASGYDTQWEAYSVAVDDDYIYVTEGEYCIQVIDARNIFDPVLAGTYDCGWADSIAIFDNYIFTSSSDGFQIIDMSNKANLTLAGQYETGIIQDIVIFGNYAYIVDGGFQIINWNVPCSRNNLSATGLTSADSPLPNSYSHRSSILFSL